MKLDYPEVKNWSFSKSAGYPYIEEGSRESDKRYLQGRVYGSKRFEDGTLIKTSQITRLIGEQNVVIVETKSGSRYIIKENTIDNKYVRVRGNVWNVVFARLNED